MFKVFLVMLLLGILVYIIIAIISGLDSFMDNLPGMIMLVALYGFIVFNSFNIFEEVERREGAYQHLKESINETTKEGVLSKKDTLTINGVTYYLLTDVLGNQKDVTVTDDMTFVVVDGDVYITLTKE